MTKNFHPSTEDALQWLSHKCEGFAMESLGKYLHAFSTCSIEGNELGERCAETINKLISKESVSELEVLGLCWAIRNIEEPKK